MRAKLINEIKTGTERGGLGSIGVGNVEVLKSYHLLNKKWPLLFNEHSKTLSTAFEEFESITESVRIHALLRIYKNAIREFTQDSLDNYINVYTFTNDSNVFKFGFEREEDVDLLYKYFNLDDHPSSVELFEDELDNGVRVVFSSICKFVKPLKIGTLFLNNIETGNTKYFHSVFVKYK